MPTTPYSYVTRAQALQQLANRLYDPTMTFWSLPEINEYLNEALRTWNALTSYWRDEFVYTQPVAGNGWVDVAIVSGTLRPYTYTTFQLFSAICWPLLEPVVGGGAINPWTGSAQFTADDLLNAVQRRQDEILSTTGCTIDHNAPFNIEGGIPAVAGRITLPDNVIDIRRMAYWPAVGSPSTLWPEDTWGEMAFNPRYLQTPAGTPSRYLQTTQPPISFDVDRPPGAAGTYELLTVNSAPAIPPTAPATLLIPDDWTHVLKWGALADLLSRESNSKDALRAQYCESRYRMGLKLLTDASAILAVRANNVPLQIDSIRAADLYQATWQSATPGTPSAAYYAGLNQLVVSPAPAVNTPITVTVVENAPVLPANVQMGRDDYDAMLDYAQHIAAFKMGGAEFLATLPLFQRFIKQASIYSSKLSEIAEYTSAILGLASREKDMNPITTPAAPTGADNAA